MRSLRQRLFGQHLLGVRTDLMMELTRHDRDRIFNLGYFTWVEQQGIPLHDFEARRQQSFWRRICGAVCPPGMRRLRR
jgi:cysteine synthase A